MSKEGVHREHQESSTELWPIGRSIVARVRAVVNSESGPLGEPEGEEDYFRDLYLVPRDTCIPDAFIGDELLDDIHQAYYNVLDAVAHELRERAGVREFLHITIDPSYMDQTYFVIHTSDVVAFSGGIKCWNLWWESEEKMAEEMQDWYERAASRFGRHQAAPETSPGGRYEVTLQLERLLRVHADDRESVLDRAVRWTDNENDPDVQLVYEEVTNHHVRALHGDSDEEDDEDRPDHV